MPTSSTSPPTPTIPNAPKSKLCRICSRKNLRGEPMTRVPSVAFRVAVAALLLSSAVSRIHAQGPAQQSPTAPPAAEPAKAPDSEEQSNPFAPEPPPVLAPGMTGSDATDPRAKLTPGLYDAGETSMGIKHLLLL